MQAALHLLGICDRAERDREGHEAVDGIARIPAECGRGTTGAQHLHIGSAVAGKRYAVVQDLPHALAVERDRHMQSFQATEKAFDMEVETEETAFPHMHGVIGGVRMEKAIVKNGDLGLRYRHELAVKIGNASRIGMWVLVPG